MIPIVGAALGGLGLMIVRPLLSGVKDAAIDKAMPVIKIGTYFFVSLIVVTYFALKYAPSLNAEVKP